MGSITDNDYKPDFEILDRYISFTSELLRISLLAIGGFGTILLINLKEGKSSLPLRSDPMLFIAICFFALCAGSALFHRYFASDSMSWYISYLRAKSGGLEEKAKTERAGLHRVLGLSRTFLILTEIIFAVAVIFFAVGIYQLIYS